jgi:biotin transport system substrate-specific component
MMKSFARSETAQTPSLVDSALHQAVIVTSASLFVALCARVTLPLPFTPIPLTLQNFGVLLVGLALGPRRAFAALVLYLLEGAAGMPVFNPAGPGGIAQLIGPTGGYLMSYPLVALVAGFGAGDAKNFGRTLLASIGAELLLFASGIAWFSLVAHMPAAKALSFTLYPFAFAEIIKIMTASALAPRVRRFVK